ncbi:MAG TPA: S-methyl-5-thioribose-1-phosphate isomerase [Thermodesulfobacteriota bacterium]|nr:S-methyl-5-thioribose-1-phosphate isomerase [Thermodesulfobacteriota bacterium]
MIKTIEWKNNQVIMIDQRKLPGTETYVVCSDYHQVIQAIKKMVIRGAPAIGVAAAMGLALGALEIHTNDPETFNALLKKIGHQISLARPTAVNLSWAIGQMMNAVESENRRSVASLKKSLVREARQMLEEDIAINRRMGAVGQKVIKNKATILTHCNAGALATGGYGTALGVIRAAKEAGKTVQVLADETRPFLQGARLTAWELAKDHIPVTLITDNMAGYLMQKGLIDLVIVGADRIAANGDTANKIGTYSVAVLAKEHGLPFYVAAPCSTIDHRLKTGKEIPIEERHEKEVTHLAGKRIAPPDIAVLNPAFDVTPHRLITGIITEAGLLKPPFRSGIARIKPPCPASWGTAPPNKKKNLGNSGSNFHTKNKRG